MSDADRRSPFHQDNSAGKDIDLKRLQYVFYASGIFGGLILLSFAFRHINSSHLALKYTLFTASIGVFLTFLYVYISKNIRVGAIISSVLLSSLIIALVVTGGQDNTGLHWIYPLLFVQFIFLGAFRGLIHSLVLLAALAAILAKPELVPADYSATEISRALASVATLVLLCFVSEYFRHRSHQDISSQHTAKMVEAVTDPLTGLTNRRFLDAFYFPDCRRNTERHFPLAVIACDIDYFKRINDESGHMVGDKVLQRIAKLLSENIRAGDVVSRVGGEEFLILAERADLDTGVAIAEKLREKLEQLEFRELEDGISASFGVEICRRFEQLGEAIEAADKRLYEAKRLGRNRVQASPSPHHVT